jgi:uncharacterized damage-inducible protein DinB
VERPARLRLCGVWHFCHCCTVQTTREDIGLGCADFWPPSRISQRIKRGRREVSAVPAEKYPWRPGEGVRSFSEVFLHVAAANYNLPKLIGTPPPDGFRVQGYDKSITDKAKVIEAMKDSFTHLRQAVINMPDADLEKQLDWFGGKNTERGILLFVMRHMAEHLGQSIAYARVNGIVPPWAEEMQQQMKPQAKPKQ